jgi:uncharacterized membrane protein
MDRQCLRRLLEPYYYMAIILALIGVIISISSSMASLNMLALSWLFYALFLMKLMDKIDFGRDTCLMDGNNLGILTLLTAFYLILSLWGLLNILFYQVLREYGMKMLFTLYSMLLTATLTSTSIIFALGSWVISRRDREDERLIAIVRVTRSLLLIVFIAVFISLLLTADFLVTQQMFLVISFLAGSLGSIITMVQTLVIMHALMDALSVSANSKGKARGQEAKEGTKGASKP